MTGQKQVKPFGIKDKLGYLFGDFGNDFTFILSSSFLLKFYTDVMGVEAAVVGIVMMVARFVDAFTDVAMGRICDRSKHTAHGKFKPWIRRMCGPVILPHLPELPCRPAYGSQDSISVCYLHSLGLSFLHINQYSLRLNGICHFRGPG